MELVIIPVKKKLNPFSLRSMVICAKNLSKYLEKLSDEKSKRGYQKSALWMK